MAPFGNEWRNDRRLIPIPRDSGRRFSPPCPFFQERFIMTDTNIMDIPQEKDDLEMAQTKEEFSRMRQLSLGDEVPADLLKMYKKYEKQRSILGINGAMHPIEKLQLSMMYDFVNKIYTLPKPKEIDGDIFNIQKQEVVEEKDDKELVETPKDYTFIEEEQVGVKFKGTWMLGTFKGYTGKDNEMAKVKVQGDSLEFRKVAVSDIKPYKEVDNG